MGVDGSGWRAWRDIRVGDARHSVAGLDLLAAVRAHRHCDHDKSYLAESVVLEFPNGQPTSPLGGSRSIEAIRLIASIQTRCGGPALAA
jgi:hypothetical protein